jgi:hypothetical protein
MRVAQTAREGKELHMSNDEFDIERATCLVPARTCVFAYIDDNGDLWISASDSALRCDAELRIAADDIVPLIEGIAELVGVSSVSLNATPKPKGAERQRRYRDRKRNARDAQGDASRV